MPLKKILILALLYSFAFSISIFAQTPSQTNSKKDLNDSLMLEIKNATDSISFMALYEQIIKNRQQLDSSYIFILETYNKKASAKQFIRGQMLALDRIGLQYRFDELYDSAIYYHNKSLEIALQLQDSAQLIYNYNNLGQAYRKQDLNVQAINYFQKALIISEARGDLRLASRTMNSMGATYVVQENYDKALQYFNGSNNIAMQLNDKRTIAYNYGSIGEVFLFQHKVDSAMDYFIKSKALIVELGGTQGYAVAEHLLGQAHYALDNYTEAEKYFKLALNLHIKEKSLRYQAFCYAYLGKIKTELNQDDSALFYLTKGKVLAESIHSYENLILINNALVDLYKKTNQWEKAISALEQKQILKDSIISIANQKEIQSLEISYETDKKEQQIKLLSTENQLKNQRIKLAVFLIIFLIISFALAIYLYLIRKKQTELMHDKLSQQLALSQMNPHFIFNALASIQHFMYKNDAKSAARYMGNFASLSRSILNNSSEDAIGFDTEIKTLTDYMELEMMRKNNSFNYEIIGITDLDTEFIKIPPMLLQPFVENAIKHGFADDVPNALITLKFTDLEDKLKVEITDNGLGFKLTAKNKDTNHQSKATHIFNERMRIIRKKYKQLPSPEIIHLNQGKSTGTKVIIYLPIINN